MGWDAGVFIFPVAVLLVIVVLLVAFTRRNLADGTAVLTPRRLVEGYIFTVVLVAMLLVSSGLSDLVQSGIARYAGIESSYRPSPVFDDDAKEAKKPKYEYDDKAPLRDLLSGSAQLGVGFIVGLLHLLGLRRLGRTEPLTASPVYRLFLIVGLVIYTVATLAYAVGTVSDLLVYRYVGAPATDRGWYDRPVPGEQIAGLIGFLPFWGLLVSRLFHYAQPRGTA